MFLNAVRRFLALIGTTALLGLALVFLPAVTASASTGSTIASIAAANLGKGACSTNSAGGTGYYTSCGEAWCADFAKWVWNQAGVNVNGLTSAAGSFGEYGAGLKSTPHVGDAVVFNYNGAGYADHMALVVAVNSNGTVTSIGGNERNSIVAEDTYSSATGYSSYWGMTINGYVAPIGGSGGSQMTNYASGQKYCLDANLSNGTLYNGDKVQIWTCNGGTNQQWRFNGSEIQNADTAQGTFCLDATDPSGSVGNGDQIQVWSCNGRSNQQWYSTLNTGSPNGWRALSNGANRSQCLDASFGTGSLFNGDKAELWACNNGANQAWTLP